MAHVGLLRVHINHTSGLRGGLSGGSGIVAVIVAVGRGGDLETLREGGESGDGGGLSGFEKMHQQHTLFEYLHSRGPSSGPCSPMPMSTQNFQNVCLDCVAGLSPSSTHFIPDVTPDTGLGPALSAAAPFGFQ